MREVELTLAGLPDGFEVGESGMFGCSRDDSAASLIPIWMVEVEATSVCGTEV